MVGHGRLPGRDGVPRLPHPDARDGAPARPRTPRWSASRRSTGRPSDLAELLEFTRSVFPGARFVLNTRDLEQVAQSKWWARNPDALAELQTIEKTYVEALAPLGDAAYRVHYDDYVADPTVLRGLFDWLGLEFDESRVRDGHGRPPLPDPPSERHLTTAPTRPHGRVGALSCRSAGAAASPRTSGRRHRVAGQVGEPEARAPG